MSTDLGARKAQLTPEQRAKVEARLRGAAHSGSRIPRRDPGLPIPLSFAQERMWMSDPGHITSPLHNAPSALRIRGPFEVARFEEGLNHIVRRHEPLRFVFDAGGPQPTQQPLPEMTINVPVRNIVAVTEEERTARTREFASDEARTPFDLARGPLLRTVVLRFAPDDHAVLLTFHHVVFDGWSKGVLIGELLEIYGGMPAAALPALSIGFGDFAAWQRSVEGTCATASAVEYWVKQLANAPAWDFPFQRSRPAAPQFEGCRRWIRFTPELSSQVRETADRAGATPFMVLLAAWAAQCARLTGVRDVVIGSLVAGRTLPETERLIGFFVNYLPLRIDCSGNPSFRALMERVRRVCLDGYEHQDAPFQAIVDRLGIARDPARHPVFSTSFTLHNGPMPAISVQGLLVEMVEFDDRLIRLDLEFDVWWSGERIEGFVVHNTALFDEDQIVTLIDDYQKLLKSLTANPDAAALAGPQLTDAAF